MIIIFSKILGTISLNQYFTMHLMKIDKKLTMLACSGSILATALFASPSYGMPGASAPQLDSTRDILHQRLASARSSRILTPPSAHSGVKTTASYERRLQLAAFSRFGCGCANCVTSIRQLVKSGELSV